MSKSTEMKKVVWEVDLRHNGDRILLMRRYFWVATCGYENSIRQITSSRTEDQAKSDFLLFARRALKPGSYKIIEG